MPTVALIGPELFPIPPIRGGATELFIDRLAAHLRRYRPLVIGVGDPELPARENRAGIDYRRIVLSPWENWFYRRYRRLLPVYDRRVAALVRELGPDLLHVHNRPLLALNLKAWFPHLPVLLHLHNTYNILGKRERPEPYTPIPVEALVACSRFVLEQERQRLGGGAKAHYVIPNGVDPAAFRPRWQRPGEAEKLRRHFGLGDEPVVLFAGKIRESKGVGLLLTAMKRVWAKFPRAVLALVGGTEFGRGRLHRETPFFKEFRRQADQAAGRVLFTGFVPPEQMPDMYLLGEVLAAPSQKPEGMPMVLLEAAACGLPLIATPMGGIPEVIKDGETGLLLTDPRDAAELADKVLTLLSRPDLRRDLGHRAREQVLQEFSWEVIASRQENLYDEVVRARQERTPAQIGDIRG